MTRDANISDEQFNEEMELFLGKKNSPYETLRGEIVQLQNDCIDDMQYKILDIVLEKIDKAFVTL